MAEGDQFPLYYPGDARPELSGESPLRRLGRQLLITHDSHVLVLGAGDGSVPTALVREFGCKIEAAEPSEADAERMRGLVKAAEQQDRISVRVVDLSNLDLPEAAYDAIWLDARSPLPLETAFRILRPLLAARGRICLTYPVKVGRHTQPALLRHWEQTLGEPLLLPRECLQIMERAGYEPQSIETLEDPALDHFYRRVEQDLDKPSADDRNARTRDEVALFRAQGGRSTTSFAVMVGRRREPGEKPPQSRSE